MRGLAARRPSMPGETAPPSTKQIEMTEMTNKQRVADFIEAMRTSNIDALSQMTTDDFRWWILGKREYLATAGEHDREFFLNFFQGPSLFPGEIEFAASSMVAEGDRVAAEAAFRAKTSDGNLYDNRYHFLFVFENDKVAVMREYMDTYHAKETFRL